MTAKNVSASKSIKDSSDDDVSNKKSTVLSWGDPVGPDRSYLTDLAEGSGMGVTCSGSTLACGCSISESIGS